MPEHLCSVAPKILKQSKIFDFRVFAKHSFATAKTFGFCMPQKFIAFKNLWFLMFAKLRFATVKIFNFHMPRNSLKIFDFGATNTECLLATNFEGIFEGYFWRLRKIEDFSNPKKIENFFGGITWLKSLEL